MREKPSGRGKKPDPPPAVKWLLRLVGLAALGSWYGGLCLFLYLSRHSPRASNEETGQTFALNNHGFVFYVRFYEAAIAQSPFFVFPMALATLALVNSKYSRDWYEHSSPLMNVVNFALGLGLILYMFFRI